MIGQHPPRVPLDIRIQKIGELLGRKYPMVRDIDAWAHFQYILVADRLPLEQVFFLVIDVRGELTVVLWREIARRPLERQVHLIGHIVGSVKRLDQVLPVRRVEGLLVWTGFMILVHIWMELPRHA